MSTVPPEGTSDPASEPLEPAEPVAEPAFQPVAEQPAPAYPDPSAASSTPPAYGQPDAAGYGQPGYQQPAYGQPAYAAATPLSATDERLWATLAHVGGILFGFLAPLVIWLVFRERSRFVEDQGKEALNFQILITIAYIVGSITTVLLIGFAILPLAWIAAVVFGIMGGIAANRGELYRYPFNWRIVK